MTMLGGVELFAQTNDRASDGPSQANAEGQSGGDRPRPLGPRDPQYAGAGAAGGGRGDLRQLPGRSQARRQHWRRARPQTEDYKTILDNKDIKAVVIATPTHQHKDIALAALKAGKHVYCEAPLANTIEDAREIALAAKAAAQHDLSGRPADARPTRSGTSCCRSSAPARWARSVMARAQWHKKTELARHLAEPGARKGAQLALEQGDLARAWSVKSAFTRSTRRAGSSMRRPTAVTRFRLD